MKKAVKRKCICETKEHIVYLSDVELVDYDIPVVAEYYCPECNSFWREP